MIKKNLLRLLLISLLLLILFIQSLVDFSLHIPADRQLLITILSMGDAMIASNAINCHH